VLSIAANGLTFACLEQGSGPLVLLLHGFPDSAHTWDRVMGELAGAGYRAVAPFMRGYHPTTIPSDGKYDTDTLGVDVLGLIEQLSPARPAIVIGHDWGATAAYAAAALGPERVRLLITLAVPHPRAIKLTPRQAWSARHFLPLRRAGAAAKIRTHDFAMIDELWRRWSPAWREIPASETAAAKACLREPGSLEAACGYYAAMPLTARPSPSARLPIKMPAVAFAGEHDPVVRTRTYEKARLCFEASYEVVIVPGGHFMHREHPQEFITELLRVLRDHEARVR